jgi:ribosomal protein S18
LTVKGKEERRKRKQKNCDVESRAGARNSKIDYKKPETSPQAERGDPKDGKNA